MSEGLKFSCPSCGNEYPWSSQVAGRKGKCKCGAVMTVPAHPPSSPLDATRTAAIAARPRATPQPVPASPEDAQDASEGAASGSAPAPAPAENAADKKPASKWLKWLRIGRR